MRLFFFYFFQAKPCVIFAIIVSITAIPTVMDTVEDHTEMSTVTNILQCKFNTKL